MANTEQFERFKEGTHSEQIQAKPLTNRQLRQVLRGVEAARLTSYLEREPLNALLIDQFDDLSRRLALAGHHAANRQIRLNLSRPASTYGQPFVAGETSSVSLAADDLPAALSRSLVHEVGHRILATGSAEVREQAFQSYLVAKERDVFVTPRAALNLEEYFCERLTAHACERRALQEADPAGHAMVEGVRGLIGVD